MHGDLITQVGAAGALVLLLTRSILDFARYIVCQMKRRNGNGSSGAMPIAFWSQRFDQQDQRLNRLEDKLDELLKRSPRRS